MIRIVRTFSRSLLVIGLAAVTASPAAAAKIITQEPCVNTTLGYCRDFEFDQPIPILRSISFNAPSAGVAVVTFHGSLLCYLQNTLDNTHGVVDFFSQIVTIPNALANGNGPGGLRHRRVLDNVAFSSDTFNLASTRVFKINAAGIQKYYFKLNKLEMNLDTKCYLYNAAFTVNFTP